MKPLFRIYGPDTDKTILKNISGKRCPIVTTVNYKGYTIVGRYSTNRSTLYKHLLDYVKGVRKK